ncbi:uroporphyrin-III [Apiospora rasikravindrae]|uniref:precorrin-2 dehydrogenase n=1 Tax=Apiospora rasikravindrae TaxID=990691 RepID=A0ABR1T9Z1_9PEZI
MMASHISMLTTTDARSHVHLIVGSNPLAASRCAQSFNVGACPLLIAPAAAELHYALQKRVDTGEVKWVKKSFEENDALTLGREELGGVVDAIFVTSGPRDPQNAQISSFCKRNRIPVNVVDSPQLSTFSLLSTHTDGPLQIGVTTNGRGCKLASRIRREIAASLPQDLGAACSRLGDARRRIQEEDHLLHSALADGGELDDSLDQTATFNKLVTEADLDAAKNRRMRWLSQICEYWPLKRLAAVSDEDVAGILKSYEGVNAPESIGRPAAKSNPTARGRIILAGSGPGHPDLLTQATHKAIQTADLILADKLVPAGVLDLIPRRTPVHIARKFPGNADAAQEELQEMAIAGVREGKAVLRLKQGDPYIYGRGGEEVAYFRRHGLGDRVTVLPGITSALSAPLFSGIPATQRDVSDQVLICTGTGKKGKPPNPPEYVATRTVVFLMALHRIAALVGELTEHTDAEKGVVKELASGEEKPESSAVQEPSTTTAPPPKRTLWPRATPCAVIERASCPDQRVIRTTLDRVVEAIEQEGSRPPGLLVVGGACEALYQSEKGRSWVVEDGFAGLEIGDQLDLAGSLGPISA